MSIEEEKMGWTIMFDFLKKRRALKEAKEVLTLLFNEITNDIETKNIQLIYNGFSLKYKDEHGCTIYLDEKIDDFQRMFGKAYGSYASYNLYLFYEKHLFSPYMESIKPKPEDFISSYEKLKNEILESVERKSNEY